MNIVFDTDQINNISDKYIVLELDKFNINGKITQSYCILDASNIPLIEMPDIQQWQKNHNKILENYHKKNWSYVEEMCNHIRNRCGGELVTFYDDIYSRVADLKKRDLKEDWSGVIER